MFVLKLNKKNNFHPLDRDPQPQLQVGKKSNSVTVKFFFICAQAQLPAACANA